MIKQLLLVFFVVFFTASQVYALDLGIENNKGKRIEKDKSLTTRNSIEKRKSSGSKKSETTSAGTDNQDQEVIKQIGQRMQHSGLDISLSLGNVFLQSLAMLESSKSILQARLLTNPRQPADFGLSAEIRPGVIDSIKADLLSKAAASNSPVLTFGNNTTIRAYRNNLALYGIIVAQAYLYFSSDLADLDAGAARDKDGNIVLKNLGYDDFLILADGALFRAVDKITNNRLRQIYKSITSDKTPCRFAGAITSIQCGSSTITIGGAPALTALGMTMFSQDQFAGFSGNYKVSSSWSYDQALEKMKSTAKYKKMAEEVSNYAETMENEGKSKEAVMTKKLAWNLAKSGKLSVTLARLIPGF